MLVVTCARCGAPFPSSRVRCAYCGADAADEVDLIAKPTFGRPGGWRLPEDRQPPGVSIDEEGGGSRLRVTVGPRSEVPLVIAAAWVGNAFVDVSASVSISFPGPVCGASAGFWLRAAGGEGVVALLWDSGNVTIATREHNDHKDTLAWIEPAEDFVAGAPGRLAATVTGDVVKVSRDRRPVGSHVVPRRAAGEIELRVQSGNAPAVVVFEDPVARED